MTNVVYWTTTENEPGTEPKLIYLLRHESREAAKNAWTLFRADPEWKRVREASEVNGKLTASVQATFLTPTDFSAAMDVGSGPPGRVFEMRTYRTLPDRLPALDARFRDHTRHLFAKHGMTNLGYFHPQDADQGAADTLLYFLAHPSREAAAKSWDSFRADPAWAVVRDASQITGPIVQPKGITSVFLTPVDFSPIR
jgi:NIPSNAP